MFVIYTRLYTSFIVRSLSFEDRALDHLLFFPISTPGETEVHHINFSHDPYPLSTSPFLLPPVCLPLATFHPYFPNLTSFVSFSSLAFYLFSSFLPTTPFVQRCVQTRNVAFPLPPRCCLTRWAAPELCDLHITPVCFFSLTHRHLQLICGANYVYINIFTTPHLRVLRPEFPFG